MVQRMTSSDNPMPPSYMNLPVSDEDKSLFERWAEEQGESEEENSLVTARKSHRLMKTSVVPQDNRRR